MPTRPCWVEISTQALEDNFRFLKKLAEPDAEVLAILKANAYGHSLPICAPPVLRAGATWLGVNSVEEGVAARAICVENAEPGLLTGDHSAPHILAIGGVFAARARR